MYAQTPSPSRSTAAAMSALSARGSARSVSADSSGLMVSLGEIRPDGDGVGVGVRDGVDVTDGVAVGVSVGVATIGGGAITPAGAGTGAGSGSGSTGTTGSGSGSGSGSAVGSGSADGDDGAGVSGAVLGSGSVVGSGSSGVSNSSGSGAELGCAEDDGLLDGAVEGAATGDVLGDREGEVGVAGVEGRAVAGAEVDSRGSAVARDSGSVVSVSVDDETTAARGAADAVPATPKIAVAAMAPPARTRVSGPAVNGVRWAAR
jgi:hypothetical protein